MTTTIHAHRRMQGFSLVEVSVGLAISGVLLSQAVPSVAQLQQRQRLEAVAQTLMTDLQQARSEAVQRADAVQLRFSQHAKGSCYVMHTGASGQCRCEEEGSAVCTANAQILKFEWLPSSRKLSIRANVSNMSFQARQGTVTSTGSIDVASASGTAIRHVVSIAGRIRSCAPDGPLKHLPKC